MSTFNKWILFRGMVCEAVTMCKLDKALFGGDLWEFSECLDMSFDEVRHKPVEMWWPIIQRDLFAYVKDMEKLNSTNS